MAQKKTAKKETKQDTKSAEMDKQKRIDAEITRLTKIFKDIEKNTRLTVKGLIEEAAYMRTTLQDLKEIIDGQGVIDVMPQGEYSILREHPAFKAYNTMVQRYTTVIKELKSALPKEVAKEVSDGFDEFVGGRDD